MKNHFVKYKKKYESLHVTVFFLSVAILSFILSSFYWPVAVTSCYYMENHLSILFPFPTRSVPSAFFFLSVGFSSCPHSINVGVPLSFLTYTYCSIAKLSPTLQPHGLQDTRLPCPLLSPRVCSNSCALSWWCHPTISSSVIHFSFCLQSFPASGSFPISQLFVSGGQSTRASASTSLLPINIQMDFL